MSSPKVTYSYANGSANTIRPTSVTYPDNTGGTRMLTYDYGTAGGMNDKLSRVESLGFGGTSNLVQPSYLGLGTQVRTDYTQPQVRWDLATGSSSNPYAGLDRFGRVIDNKWSNTSTSATLDQIKYTYDRASNRTTRENTVAKAQTTPQYFDELYNYDGSNRLTQMQRGQLAGTTSITNLRFAQDWGLDPTGNWQQFNEDSNGSGTNDLVQARTANPVNEITDITNSVGTPWVQLGYDAAGNMTTIPNGNVPEEGFTGVYDAWNRLVKLLDEDDNVVAEYAYDGLTRRIRKTTAAETRHYLYNDSWQILEERREEFEAWDLLTTSSSSSSSSSTSSSSSSSSDNPNYDFYQYVWGLRYIDGLVFRDRHSTSGVERLYALQDANWNVDALVDTSGSVAERFSYTAYGVPTFLNPDFTAKTGSDYAWDVLYAGYKWDAESGMYQVRRRYLLSVIGAWLSRDPVGYGMIASLYPYVSNTPASSIDAFGLQENDVCCECNERKRELSGKSDFQYDYYLIYEKSNVCRVNLICEPVKECNGLPGKTQSAKRAVPNGVYTHIIDICISCRFKPFDIVFEHELVHATQFCRDPLRTLATCDDCVKGEKEAHAINCRMSFPDDAKRYDRCLKCGVAISCQQKCPNTNKDANGNVTVDDVACDMNKDLGGRWAL